MPFMKEWSVIDIILSEKNWREFWNNGWRRKNLKKSVYVFGSEAWVLKKRKEQRLEAA